MISTFELDKVISDIMPNKDVAEMHTSAVVGGVSKEHFGKMFYFYLVDRNNI